MSLRNEMIAEYAVTRLFSWYMTYLYIIRAIIDLNEDKEVKGLDLVKFPCEDSIEEVINTSIWDFNTSDPKKLPPYRPNDPSSSSFRLGSARHDIPCKLFRGIVESILENAKHHISMRTKFMKVFRCWNLREHMYTKMYEFILGDEKMASFTVMCTPASEGKLLALLPKPQETIDLTLEEALALHSLAAAVLKTYQDIVKERKPRKREMPGSLVPEPYSTNHYEDYIWYLSRGKSEKSFDTFAYYTLSCFDIYDRFYQSYIEDCQWTLKVSKLHAHGIWKVKRRERLLEHILKNRFSEAMHNLYTGTMNGKTGVALHFIKVYDLYDIRVKEGFRYEPEEGEFARELLGK
jgi:hypothetical protein